jgi:steroid 5-alpha reductase family enzyme
MRSALSPERTRACLAIAVAWAGLAVVLGAYAIGRESAGALLLALVVIWWMRLAWVSAWQDAEIGDER